MNVEHLQTSLRAKTLMYTIACVKHSHGKIIIIIETVKFLFFFLFLLSNIISNIFNIVSLFL